MIEVFVTLVFAATVFMAGVYVGSVGQEVVMRRKILSAENIIKCFDGVDWSIQAFSCDGSTVKTTDGVEHFYKVPSIKRAIAKLDKLLEKSER